MSSAVINLVFKNSQEEVITNWIFTWYDCDAVNMCTLSGARYDFQWNGAGLLDMTSNGTVKFRIMVKCLIRSVLVLFSIKHA